MASPRYYKAAISETENN